MRIRRTRKELLEGRVRELRRVLLHEKDSITRKIYKDHILFLSSEISQLEGGL